jgi:hypothetical protein
MPTESQLRDTELRMRVRQRIEQGTLPVVLPNKIFAGYGTGHRCVACDEEITQTQVEYEVAESPGRPLRFHLGCHVVWQLESGAATIRGDLSANPAGHAPPALMAVSGSLRPFDPP